MNIARLILSLTLTASGISAQSDSDLASPGPGPFVDNVTAVGTLGIDIQYAYPGGRILESMTIHGLDLSTSPSTVIGARVYDVDEQRLIACHQTTWLSSSSSASLTMPIRAHLEFFKHYRVAFYFPSAVPADMPQAISFPYGDHTVQFIVHGAYQSLGDAYPSAPSNYMPWIELHHFPEDGYSKLDEGGGGTEIVPWSLNETRGVDVRPLTRRRVTSIRVRDFTTIGTNDIVARIWDSATGTLLATSALTATPGLYEELALPIEPIYVFPDTDYRVSVYLEDGYIPLTFPNALPYDEPENVFQVTGGYNSGGDSFPTTSANHVPAVWLFSERIIGTNVNTGTAVGGVNTPTLHSCTTPTIGETLRLRVQNGGTGPATIVLALTATPTQAPLFGLLPMVDTPLDTPTVMLSGGNGSLVLPIPFDPAAIGLPLASQAFVPDVTSPGDLPVSHSDILVSTLGF